MISSLSRALLIAVVLSILATAGHASSVNQPKIKGIFGVNVGLFGRGAIKIDETEYDTNHGFSAGVCLDYPVYKVLYLGAYVDVDEIRIPLPSREVNFIEEKEILLDIGLSTKTHLPLWNGKVIFRPGCSVGYAFLNEIRFLEKSEYVTFRLVGELIFGKRDRVGVLTQFGAFWGSGGDGEYDVSGGPLLILRGGMVF